MRVYYEKKKKKSKLDTLSGDDDAYGYSATGYIYQQLTGRQFFFMSRSIHQSKVVSNTIK